MDEAIDETPGGGRFLRAFLARDFDGIAASIAPDARFRFLIPAGPREVMGGSEIGGRFRAWFGDVDAFEVLSSGVDIVGDRISIRYRLRVHDEMRWQEVEQQAYAYVDDHGLIESLDLLCSGFRPAPAQAHAFDAGSLGCADGLAQEFRRRIRAIPIGDALVVATHDPAAKEDLPPLARLMGHTVRSVESPGDGRLLITVERGR